MNPTVGTPQPEDKPKPEQDDVLNGIPSSTEVNPSPRNERKRKQCRPDQTPWWKWAIEIAAILVAGWVAIVYSRQLGAMIDSNNINREALTSVQRAFMFVEGYDALRIVDADPKKVVGVRIFPRLRNSGTTQAKEARFHANHIPYPLPENFTYPDFDSKGNIVVDSGEKGFFPPQFSGTVDAPFDVYRTSGNRVVSYGWIKYRDVFTNTAEHVTLFCRILTVDFTANSSGPGNISVSSCEHHNCTDEQCEKQ